MLPIFFFCSNSVAHTSLNPHSNLYLGSLSHTQGGSFYCVSQCLQCIACDPSIVKVTLESSQHVLNRFLILYIRTRDVHCTMYIGQYEKSARFRNAKSAASLYVFPSMSGVSVQYKKDSYSYLWVGLKEDWGGGGGKVLTMQGTKQQRKIWKCGCTKNNFEAYWLESKQK